jgi:hypothetical protein
MTRLVWNQPTPSSLAGLRGSVDTSSPRMPKLTAAGLIAAIYLLFFAVGILNAAYVIKVELVLPETDYTTFRGIAQAVTNGAEILGAMAILVLVIHALGIHRPLAGLPATRPAPSHPCSPS